MKTSDFYYELPEELIAQTPLDKRDSSRLMVYNRETGEVSHKKFHEIGQFLGPKDALVLNNTKVIPARLIGRKQGGGAKVELLLLKRLCGDLWESLVKPGRKAPEGTVIEFGGGMLRAVVESKTPSGGRLVRFSYEGIFERVLDCLGEMPLPPYIHAKLKEKDRYQTVYARYEGSAAAPTAGLHFTPELLEQIRHSGTIVTHVLLHVGLGTFRPVSEEDISRHVMHEEAYQIPTQTADILNRVHRDGGRVVAVGTTCTRVLETVADENGLLCGGSGQTSIFIYPGYRFKAIDALVTNFHLPQSTLLMLVSALVGRERALSLYELAVQERYRFFSFGDAMMIL
ncbi:MAG: tRNA preQ1(34) S-adenosylmethionine ribosyltransferase-isomerase QueA [Christensenellales bacterium]